jgi:hypothetical protein
LHGVLHALPQFVAGVGEGGHEQADGGIGRKAMCTGHVAEFPWMFDVVDERGAWAVSLS